jgi:hypothetical protein
MAETVKVRKYPKDEFARRGDEAYARYVEPNLTAVDKGKFAAVDIETGEYELGTSILDACDKLNARLPESQIWTVRVGSRYLARFGGRERRTGE